MSDNNIMTTDNRIVNVSTEDSRGTEFDTGNKMERMVAGALSGDVQIAFDAVRGFLQKDSLIKEKEIERK